MYICETRLGKYRHWRSHTNIVTLCRRDAYEPIKATEGKPECPECKIARNYYLRNQETPNRSGKADGTQ